MHVRVNDRRCLTPRVPAPATGAGGRVVGMLETGEPGRRHHRLVHEVVYDGRACRYRIDDAGGGTDGHGESWLSDDDATSYRPFCHLIIERLVRRHRAWVLRLHRLPGLPPSRALTRRAYRAGEPGALTALDSCLTADGELWLEVAVGGRRRGHERLVAARGAAGRGRVGASVRAAPPTRLARAARRRSPVSRSCACAAPRPPSRR